MKKIIKIQFFILLIGSVFIWSDFVIKLFDWLNYRSGQYTAEAAGNPFLSTSFYGAVFFSLALILNLMLLVAGRKINAGPGKGKNSISEEKTGQAGPEDHI